MHSKKYANITYSQMGEDLHIQRILNSRYGKKITDKGFYLDVGAFHPFKYSNTFKFYELGWRGINIEPNPENFKLIEKYRPEDINLNMGVSEKKQVLKYWKYDRGAFNTFSEAEATELNKRGDLTLEKVLEIETDSLQNILTKHLPDNTPIDFISIDVEGLDFQVVKSFDLETFKPNIICIEENMLIYNHFSESDIYKYLNDHNYKLQTIIGKSNIYIRKS